MTDMARQRGTGWERRAKETTIPEKEGERKMEMNGMIFNRLNRRMPTILGASKNVDK